MITLPEYLVKISVSLSVLYLFYRLVLNRLTFYQWNRVYLLGYSLLSFVLPFVDISPWIEKQGMETGTLAQLPSFGNYVLPPDSRWPLAVWLSIALLTGMAILSVRLLLSYLSLRRIRKQAVLWQAGDGVRLFDTDARINPFSFGRSIYLNKRLHSEDELQRIIQHEMVHVKQKHTVDLIIGELVSILNWYNPFAWLIRHALRQNLEFIADKNVLDNGFDKKEYQYLLLKVVGLQQYGIVNNFSLPHLKKRIMMMNKMKSATLHLTRFLFALPLLSVVLLAFRSEKLRTDAKPPLTIHRISRQDTVPVEITVAGHPGNEPKTVTGHPINHKYSVSVANDGFEHLVIIRDNKHKIIKAMTMADWKAEQVTNEKKYGGLPPELWVVGQGKPGTDQNLRIEDVKLETAQTPPGDSKTVTVVGRKSDQASVNRVQKEDMKSSMLGAIVIRSSDSASSGKPLIILDGKPQPPDFNLKSVPDQLIHSISVLKGSTATDKYGERAKDGAIEIISKTPEQQKTDTLQLRR